MRQVANLNESCHTDQCVTHINESSHTDQCVTHKWVESHKFIICVTHVNASSRKSKWVMSHRSMCHTYKWVESHRSMCHTYKWVESHRFIICVTYVNASFSQIKMMHVTHVDGQCHTCDRVTHVMRHVACINELCHAYESATSPYMNGQVAISIINDLYICMHVDGGITNSMKVCVITNSITLFICSMYDGKVAIAMMIDSIIVHMMMEEWPTCW